MTDNSSLPTQQETNHLKKAHGQRAKAETLIALIGGLVAFVGVMSGLDRTVQLILGGAVATVILAAVASFIRAGLARRK